MNRAGFLKATAAAIAAPYLARVERVADALAALAPPAARTLTVSGGAAPFFRVGDIVRVTSTGEALMVTSASRPLGRARYAFDVCRGIGSVAPQPIKSGDDLVIVGGQSQEGESLGCRNGRHFGPHFWIDDAFEPRVAQLA